MHLQSILSVHSTNSIHLKKKKIQLPIGSLLHIINKQVIIDAFTADSGYKSYNLQKLNILNFF